MSRVRPRALALAVARTLAIVGPLVIPFAILELPVALAERRLRAPVPGVHRPSIMYLVFYAVAYGVLRAFAFHPVYRPGYRAWLEATPWTVSKRLPLGPVELSWADGLVLGLLILLAATLPEPRAATLLCLFLLAHLLALTPSFWLTRCEAFGYATAFALGLAVRFWHRPVACVAALAGVYAIAYEGLWRGMARFPGDWPKLPLLTEHADPRYRPRPASGWPHDRMLGEVVDGWRIRKADALLGCLLAVWWLDGLISLHPDPETRKQIAAVVFGVATQFAALGRLGIYVGGHHAPLSLWARIRMGRWIIPGYDKVFIGPICVPLAGLATLALLMACRVPAPSGFATAAGMSILAALITPPSLRRWHLTGRHRIVPSQNQTQPKDKNPFVQVT